jgi:hypothetical protein
MKKVVFSNLCWYMAFTAKSKATISKMNGLEGPTWIKSRVIMKKTFKDWKAHLIVGPQMIIWSFQVRWVIGPIIME